MFFSCFSVQTHTSPPVGSGKSKNDIAPSREVNRMYEAQKKHGTDTDQELIDVLVAISVVSRRLAMKLALIQSQSTEGGKQDEQNERYGCDHRRIAHCCCRY